MVGQTTRRGVPKSRTDGRPRCGRACESSNAGTRWTGRGGCRFLGAVGSSYGWTSGRRGILPNEAHAGAFLSVMAFDEHAVTKERGGPCWATPLPITCLLLFVYGSTTTVQV